MDGVHTMIPTPDTLLQYLEGHCQHRKRIRIQNEQSSQQYSLPMRGWQYCSQYSLPTNRLQGCQGRQGLGFQGFQDGLDFKVVKAGRALETAATSEASVVALCSGGGRGGSVIFGQVITGAHIVKLLENVQNRSMLTIEVASAATLLLNHGWRARKGWKCNLQIYCPKIQNRKYACVCSPLRCWSGFASTCTVLLPISPFSPKHGLMSGDFLASTFS